MENFKREGLIKYEKPKKQYGTKLLLALLIISIPADPIFSINFRIFIIACAAIYIIADLKICLTSYFKFGIIFTMLLYISSLYAPGGAQSLSIVKSYLISFLQSFMIVLLTAKLNGDAFSKVKTALNFFVLGTCIIALYSFFVEFEEILKFGGKWRLGSIVFENDGTFMMLSYSLIISMVWVLYNLIENKNAKFIIPVVVLMIMSFASGTKKVIFTIFLFGIFYVFIKYKDNFIKLFAAGIVITIILFIGFYSIMNVEILYQMIGKRVENFILATFGDEKGTVSTVQRADMREYGMELFSKSPLLGNGTASFRWYYYLKTGFFLYSHCNYVELLCNHGIVGFILYYGYYLWLTIKSLKFYNSTRKPMYLFCIIFLIIVFINDYGQISYYRIHYMTIIQLIAYIIYCRNKEIKLNSRKCK